MEPTRRPAAPAAAAIANVWSAVTKTFLLPMMPRPTPRINSNTAVTMSETVRARPSGRNANGSTGTNAANRSATNIQIDCTHGF
jgi:hypothetical protein